MPPSVKPSRRPHATDPIGVFDSGVGGLSILQHLRRLMPHERFIFLADQAHVPYGAQSPESLRSLAHRITRFLLSGKTKLVVVACNTSTCYSISSLRSSFLVPFVGTVPAIKPACERSSSKVVAVISTPATAKSDLVRDLVKRFNNGCRVLRIGCAGLEEAVEDGVLDSPQTKTLLSKYLTRARKAGADQLVLGCTHYPFLKRRIRSLYPVTTVDSGAAIARRTRSILTEVNLLRPSGKGSASYWTTGNPRSFSNIASMLLGSTVRAKKAKI